MDKRVPDLEQAISDIGDGASIMVGGFGDSGFPTGLVTALQRKAPRNLTLIHNGAGLGSLVTDGCIKRLICSYPVGPTSVAILPALEAGSTELEVIPQGTLVERIRAGGAGLGGVLTPVGVDMTGTNGSVEIVEVDGRPFVLGRPIRARFALIRGDVADELGNVHCRNAARNFNVVMATAADTTIVEVRSCVKRGELRPEDVHIPAPFVDRIVVIPQTA
jgi:3-oxoadipate CoA-transferase alpha subunit